MTNAEVERAGINHTQKLARYPQADLYIEPSLAALERDSNGEILVRIWGWLGTDIWMRDLQNDSNVVSEKKKKGSVDWLIFQSRTERLTTPRCRTQWS